MFKAYTGYLDATFYRLRIIYFTIFIAVLVYCIQIVWLLAAKLKAVWCKLSLRVTLARLANK